MRIQGKGDLARSGIHLKHTFAIQPTGRGNSPNPGAQASGLFGCAKHES